MLNPNQIEFGVGDVVSFTCTVEGFPIPTKLTFGNTDGDLKTYVSSGSEDSEITTSTYGISYIHTIDSLALSDTSTYSCYGENNNGAIKTAVTTADIIIGTFCRLKLITVSLVSSEIYNKRGHF